MEELTRAMIDGTNRFRNSDHPVYSRIRQLLLEKGVDSSTSVLVELFSDDSAFQYGIIITENRDIFQFGYDYLDRNSDEGEFTEWEDLTNTYNTHNWCEEIIRGLDLVQRDL